MNTELFRRASAGQEELPEDVEALLARLAALHGDILLSRESSGLHASMASPACLEEDGSIELAKKHLSLNLDRYFGLGAWANRYRTYNADYSALCMKTGTAYAMSELLHMKPLEERGIATRQKAQVYKIKKEHRLIDDGKGNRVPEEPGTVLSLSSLSADHPAIIMLRQRNFDPVVLERHLNVAYCSEEMPEDRSIGRVYRKLPCGFKDTPQGRLIFYAHVKGVRVSWQARLIEALDPSGLYRLVWHPYQEQWVPVYYRHNEEADWALLADFEKDPYGRKWDPSKYRTATGSSRANLLMGFDQALAWNAGRSKRTIILCEGPLDAGRIGAPAVAILGKFLSAGQAELVRNAFDDVIYVQDRGEAGDSAVVSVRKALAGMPLCCVTPPEGVDDPGDISPDAVIPLRNKWFEALQQTGASALSALTA